MRNLPWDCTLGPGRVEAEDFGWAGGAISQIGDNVSPEFHGTGMTYVFRIFFLAYWKTGGYA